MGKGQSKSYDLGTAPEKANHKRPKSSQQRESLLLSRNSANLNGESQKPLDNEDNSYSPEDQEVNKSEELNQPIKENGAKSPEPIVNGISETETEENRQKSVNEVTENSEKDSLKEENLPESNTTSDYNPQEESDQIDKALDDYIQSQKSENKDSDREEGKQEEEVETEVKQEVKEEVKEEINEEGLEERLANNTEVIPASEDNDSKLKEPEKDFVVGEESDKEKEEIVKETKTEVTEEVQEEREEKQEANSDLESEKPVEEVVSQFKTVITLESSPSDTDQDRTSQQQDELVVDPVSDSPPDPVIPVEEPTLPESASVVSSEVNLPVQLPEPEEDTEVVEEEDTTAMSLIEAEVCGVDDLKDGEMKEVDVGEGKALLVKENGQFYAVGSKCTHYGAPLAKGAYCKGRVRCPWHGACFNVKTGDIEDFPGLDNIPKFEVTVADGKVKVKGNKDLLTSSKSQKSMCKQSGSNSESVLIIGGGASSVMCAETLRAEGFTGKVTIATQEKYLPYDRPKLSKAMDLTPGSNALRSAEFYATNGIDVLTGKKATAVDTSGKSVSFEDASSLSYTSLVVATGGTPRKLPIPGANFDNVCLLRTPDDANKIAEQAKDKKVVIIGSSFIGMEVAAFLADKAESVSVVDIIKVPFQLVLGEKVGSVLKKLHEENGVKFYLERGIKEFVGSNNVASEAVLSDDTRLPCDLVVLGVGVVPATDFLKDSGISMTNRGFITVDKNMKTNVDGVYATGDIVEFPLFIADNQQANVQHWQMAHAHGQAAARAILNKGDGIKSVPFFWTMMYKKSIRYTGYGMGYDDIVIHGDLEGHSFVAYYTKGDKVVAVATLGTDPTAAKVAEIFYNGQTILKSEIQDEQDFVIEKFGKL